MPGQCHQPTITRINPPDLPSLLSPSHCTFTFFSSDVTLTPYPDLIPNPILLLQPYFDLVHPLISSTPSTTVFFVVLAQALAPLGVVLVER